MSHRINAAAFALLITAAVQAAETAPATPPAPPATTPPAAPVLAKGIHAWTTREVFLRLEPAGNQQGSRLAAGVEVRVKDQDARKPDWWQVDALDGGWGWMMASGLTAQRAPGLADTLVPMLGDRSTEIAAIRAGLKSADVKERIAACKSLAYSGITDEALFDSIAHDLAEGLAQSDKVSGQMWGAIAVAFAAGAAGGVLGNGIAGAAAGAASAVKPGERNPREWAQEVAWLTKALSWSGYSKYRPFLERASDTESLGSGRISSHAIEALANLEKFARWNRIINDPAGMRPDRSPETARLVNMLKSGDRALLREALNRMKLQPVPSPQLYDEVEAQLRAGYAADFDGNEDGEDAIALMEKALGGTGNAKYEPVLRAAQAEAKSSKIREHAAAALAALGKAATH